MFSLSFSKLLFVFSVISVILITNVVTADEYELVESVCSKVGNEPFCLAVLKSNESSKFAKDIKTLATIAIDAATQNSTSTRDYFLSVKTGPPAVLKSLKDCIDSYHIVINGFTNCLKEEDCSLIGYDIHDAGDEVRRCQAMTDSNGAHDSFITASNNITLDFCGLGESLANRMCDQTGA